MNSIFDKNLDECKQIIIDLKKQSFLEQPTGLKNRQALLLDIDKKSYTLLALLDIDRLRFINDLYGIKIGNQIIKLFANFLENQTIKNEYQLYQTAGDEFVICTNSDDISKFKGFIDKLSFLVTDLPLYVEEISEEISIDITIGVTYEFAELFFMGVHLDSRLLLIQADTALHFAKSNTKRLVEYDESMNNLQDMQNIIEWKEKIKNAIQLDNIIPVFHPIVDCNGHIIKYETLMRLRDDTGSLISPIHFLETSILIKQYALLSKTIIKKALDYLVKSDKVLSINLRYSDLLDKEIITLIDETLKRYPVGNRLIFEIVESEDIKNYDLLQEFIDRFKPYGVKMAIDDFGTGFSNFINIIQTNPDYIKIDGSLVKNINSDKISYSFVKAIVQVSHELGIKVIAEYVHSKEVFDVLKEIDVDEYQGFYFYEPSISFMDDKVEA